MTTFRVPCTENRTKETWWWCAVCHTDQPPQQATMYWDGHAWVASACLHHPIDPTLFSRTRKDAP